MLLASYVGTRSGIMGLGNRIIRLRLVEGGHKWSEAFKTNASDPFGPLRASHTELVFEPEDDVSVFMPDKSCMYDDEGKLWCFSSTGTERVHPESRRRANHIGGARFKRIDVYNDRWSLQRITRVDPKLVAARCESNAGQLYDWQNILGFASWIIPHKKDRRMCSELVMEMLGVRESYRVDPCMAIVVAEHL